MIAPRQLAGRVDALVIAYRVRLAKHVGEALARAAEHAARFGAAEITTGEPGEPDRHHWELKRTRAEGRFHLANGDLRALVDLHAPGRRRDEDGGEIVGWTVELVARAVWLARTPHDRALVQMGAAARSFGTVSEERLRRFDVCTDWAGWAVVATDADTFVKPSRARIGAFHPDERIETADNDLLRTQTYRSRIRAVTGFTVAPGGTVMLRIYDKLAELELPGNEAKREIETTLWKANGWEGDEVTRVEFQLRGEALDELKLRDPRVLPAKLDAVWAYLTRCWVRMVDPDSATRLKRCKLDDRWRAVRRVFWVGPDAPAVRLRQRGGASWQMALGSVLSLLSGRDALPVLEHVDADGVLSSYDELAELQGEERELVIYQGLAEVLARAHEVLGEEVSRHREGPAWLAARVDATRARFAELRALREAELRELARLRRKRAGERD